uniref:Death associated protein n=1 Tax=Oryctolagus cuniculus TaxID=9986 RepID=G1TUF2_RABIT
MSSPPEGKLETKAGHPPAGTGRLKVDQKQSHHDSKQHSDVRYQCWALAGLWAHTHTNQLCIPCLPQGDKDFPPAAAQVAHQKPHASMDKHPSPRTPHIQQPRK